MENERMSPLRARRGQVAELAGVSHEGQRTAVQVRVLWPQTHVWKEPEPSSGRLGIPKFFLGWEGSALWERLGEGPEEPPHPGAHALQLLKLKCRSFLCTNAKPFPVSLLVGYKNNHW